MNIKKKSVLMILLAEMLNMPFRCSDVFMADLWDVMQPPNLIRHSIALWKGAFYFFSKP